MRFQIQQRGGRRVEVHPQFERIGTDTIIGSTQWLDGGGRRHERYQVLMLRDGKIANMQGFASRRAAERFARR